MKISEIFSSFQGEGLNTGIPAVFFRLAGCNLNCSWCDTNHEARVIMSPKDAAEAVAKMVLAENIQLVVVTGGEPLIQHYELFEFIAALRQKALGVKIAVETNGTVGIEHRIFDFIAVSPKLSHDFVSARPEVLRVADEIKIVVDDFFKLNNYTIMAHLETYKVPVWLQPEGNKPEYLTVCEELAKKFRNARVGHQIHKMRNWK